VSGGAELSPWVRSRWKRILDVVMATLAIPALLPLALFAALLVRLAMGKPALFVQERIGRHGRQFRLLKFRTMTPVPGGLGITGAGDPRVTQVGRWLRRTKIDEIPQIVNVIRGDMAIVGPRPEVPRYVALYTPAQRRILEARPGLTDPATLAFRDEERLLGSVPWADRESYYVSEVLPGKLQLNGLYLARATLGSDLILIFRTMAALLRPGPARPPS